MEVTLNVKRYDPDSERPETYYRDYGFEIDDNAIDLSGILDAAEIVQHVLQDFVHRAFQRIAVAAAAGAVEDMHVALPDALTGEFCRHFRALGRVGDVEDLDPADGALVAAENAPGHVVVAFVLVRDEAVAQHALRLDHAEAAARAPGARLGIVAQLVAVADHRQVHGQVFQRVVAGVGHQVVDAVGTVR